MSRLQAEIRQKRPFRSRQQEAVLALLRTADLLRHRMGRVVEPHDLSLEQYNVLRILRGAGAEGLPTLEIAGRMVAQTPGITRLLDKLESKGLIRRERHGDDRRRVICWIRETGLELLTELEEPVHEATLSNMQGLTARELDQLIEQLDRIRAEKQ